MNTVRDPECEKLFEHINEVNLMHKKYKLIKKILRIADSLHQVNRELEDADSYFKDKQKEFEGLFVKAERIKTELQDLLDPEEKDLSIMELKEHIKKKINKK